MIPRAVFWLILVAAVWWLLWARKPKGSGRSRRHAPFQKTSHALMIQCAYCGVHFPGDEAVTSTDGRQFCLKAHEKAAVRAGPV